MDKDERQLISTIRHNGSMINKAMTPVQLRSTAQRLINQCQTLLDMLGWPDEEKEG
jgi:hypothetical protein